ncbi:hypothetical protein MASR1M101_06050 [Gemmatimonas sp.]
MGDHREEQDWEDEGELLGEIHRGSREGMVTLAGEAATPGPERECKQIGVGSVAIEGRQVKSIPHEELSTFLFNDGSFKRRLTPSPGAA